MARGHADAAGALKITGGPGQGGYRGDLGIYVGCHAVRSKNRGGSLNKQLALVAAITRDSNRGVLKRLV